MRNIPRKTGRLDPSVTESMWTTVRKELPPSSLDRTVPNTVTDGSSFPFQKCADKYCRSPREIGIYCRFCALDLEEEQPEPVRAWAIHCFMNGHLTYCRGTIEAATKVQQSGKLRCPQCGSRGVELERERMWSLQETRHPLA